MDLPQRSYFYILVNLEHLTKISIMPIYIYARSYLLGICIIDAVTSSGILKAKQKLGVTFHSDKLGGIAFTKISKLTMCSA